VGNSSHFENIEERRQANIEEAKSSRSRANERMPDFSKRTHGTSKSKAAAGALKSQKKLEDEKWQLIEKLGNEKKKAENLKSINRTITQDNLSLKSRLEAQEIKVAATLLRLDDVDAKLRSLKEEVRLGQVEFTMLHSENRKIANDLDATKEFLRKLEGRLDWMLEVGTVKSVKR